ncbi:hypothetical protein PM3016_7227 [Paenibacillus mucilaginosus 3016]|uniref:Uncharacterized protein n=3 Tax=Paenibacillus mucilaginosus TaxID=61624 RepID=H6NBN4_9BACL|nr:hypothetical protein KNP414_07699 [Paenibacillus mucilaginosus KNP414]AFC33803.1 hypothetical protein PM3016_7227 [Paenibacillus mucilaginosus 3016]WDM27510.1 hypothetical protein KCX80_35075 [Paenibacillus mucilaginosus]WFA22193.1 hypothetical protein ERY13_35990 [Paenibacillus mucilaginosus]
MLLSLIPCRIRRNAPMKIETNAYQIAPLTEQTQVVDIIQEAESKLARMTGSEITLIAYSKKGEEPDGEA